MSTLVLEDLCDDQEERAFEAFIEAYDNDDDFSVMVYGKLFDGLDQILLKDGDDPTDCLIEVFDRLLEWNWEETVRNPIAAAYEYSKEA